MCDVFVARCSLAFLALYRQLLATSQLKIEGDKELIIDGETFRASSKDLRDRWFDKLLDLKEAMQFGSATVQAQSPQQQAALAATAEAEKAASGNTRGGGGGGGGEIRRPAGWGNPFNSPKARGGSAGDGDDSKQPDPMYERDDTDLSASELAAKYGRGAGGAGGASAYMAGSAIAAAAAGGRKKGAASSSSGGSSSSSSSSSSSGGGGGGGRGGGAAGVESGMMKFLGEADKVKADLAVLEEEVRVQTKRGRCHSGDLSAFADGQVGNQDELQEEWCRKVRVRLLAIKQEHDRLLLETEALKKEDAARPKPQHSSELKARANVLALIARKMYNVHRDFNRAENDYKATAKARVEEKFRVIDPTATSAEIDAAVKEHGSVQKLMQAQIMAGRTQNEQVANAARDAMDMHRDVMALQAQVAEVQTMFTEMATLVELQAPLLDNIMVRSVCYVPLLLVLVLVLVLAVALVLVLVVLLRFVGTTTTTKNTVLVGVWAVARLGERSGRGSCCFVSPPPLPLVSSFSNSPPISSVSRCNMPCLHSTSSRLPPRPARALAPAMCYASGIVPPIYITTLPFCL